MAIQSHVEAAKNAVMGSIANDKTSLSFEQIRGLAANVIAADPAGSKAWSKFRTRLTIDDVAEAFYFDCINDYDAAGPKQSALGKYFAMLLKDYMPEAKAMALGCLAGLYVYQQTKNTTLFPEGDMLPGMATGMIAKAVSSGAAIATAYAGKPEASDAARAAVDDVVGVVIKRAIESKIPPSTPLDPAKWHQRKGDRDKMYKTAKIAVEARLKQAEAWKVQANTALLQTKLDETKWGFAKDRITGAKITAGDMKASEPWLGLDSKKQMMLAAGVVGVALLLAVVLMKAR